MNILYCGDGNIADGVLLSTLSLLRTVQEPLNIYILTADIHVGATRYTGLAPDFAERLDRQVKATNEQGSVRLFDITERFGAELPAANMMTRFTPGCMLRLYADEVEELPDRILYLDNDVLCRLDPAAFYHQDLQGCAIAGSLDYYGSWFFRRSPFRRDYLNSGVLLLDLAAIRENGLFARCRERCRTTEMFMPDQSAINKLCTCKKICPRRYNEQRRLHSDTVFQHFTTSFRFFPWFHTVSVKPWNTEGMHGILKLHEYDDLLSEYHRIKEQDFCKESVTL